MIAINSIDTTIFQRSPLSFIAADQKKIAAIAIAIFACFCFYYLVRQCYHSFTNQSTCNEENNAQQKSSLAIDEVRASHFSDEFHDELKKAIGELSDPCSIKDDELFDSDDDDTLEKQAIKARLTDPASQKFIEGLSKYGYHKCIQVLAGIKPACVIDLPKPNSLTSKIKQFVENFIWEQPIDPIIPLVQELAANLNDVHVKILDNEIIIVNESPLTAFDPRLYLWPLQDVPSGELHLSVIEAWKDGHKVTDSEHIRITQMLSYLLGYGPSWEAYANGQNEWRESDYTDFNQFSDEHFRQLGDVLLQNTIDFGEQDSVSIGRAYHTQFPHLLSEAQNHFWQKCKINAQLERAYCRCNSIEKICRKAGMAYIHDGISSRTQYSKKQLRLQKWLRKYLKKQKTI